MRILFNGFFYSYFQQKRNVFQLIFADFFHVATTLIMKIELIFHSQNEKSKIVLINKKKPVQANEQKSVQ